MNPLTDWSQILIGVLGKTTGMFLACSFEILSEVILLVKIVIYDQARVIGELTLATLGSQASLK